MFVHSYNIRLTGISRVLLRQASLLNYVKYTLERSAQAKNAVTRIVRAWTELLMITVDWKYKCNVHYRNDISVFYRFRTDYLAKYLKFHLLTINPSLRRYTMVNNKCTKFSWSVPFDDLICFRKNVTDMSVDTRKSAVPAVIGSSQ